MLVSEIFTSIEGEGKRAGYLATFIRFWGCDMQCSYCDSRYAWEPGTKHVAIDMTVDDIVAEVDKAGVPLVTITGGEPLIQPQLGELVDRLINKCYWVNIETNGAHKPLTARSAKWYDNALLFYTMDFKCYSSGMTDRMNWDALRALRTNDVLKFVVGSENDLKQMETVLAELHTPTEVFVSPVYGQIEAKDIVRYLKEHQLNHVRVQLQLHKYIWDSNLRGV